MKTSILIVEDDKGLQKLLITALEASAYQCYVAGSGTDAMLLMTSKEPDIVILDLGLTNLEGLEMIEKVRTWSRCLIMAVGEQEATADKVKALDAGADDYLTKPFSIDELLARLRAKKRRTFGAPQEEEQLSHYFQNGPLIIDYAAETVTMNGEQVHLMPMEYKLICLLAKNVGRVLTYDFILKEIWGLDVESERQSLRVFIAILRKKIENETSSLRFIQTHISVGYRMLQVTGEEEPEPDQVKIA